MSTGLAAVASDCGAAEARDVRPAAAAPAVVTKWRRFIAFSYRAGRAGRLALAENRILLLQYSGRCCGPAMEAMPIPISKPARKTPAPADRAYFRAPTWLASGSPGWSGFDELDQNGNALAVGQGLKGTDRAPLHLHIRIVLNRAGDGAHHPGARFAAQLAYCPRAQARVPVRARGGQESVERLRFPACSQGACGPFAHALVGIAGHEALQLFHATPATRGAHQADGAQADSLWLVRGQKPVERAIRRGAGMHGDRAHGARAGRSRPASATSRATLSARRTSVSQCTGTPPASISQSGERARIRSTALLTTRNRITAWSGASRCTTPARCPSS